MSYIKAVDVSQWQGGIDWAAVKRSGVDIAIIKMSGGDAGLYTDSRANANYYNAKANGLALAGYHFAGGNDPINEADFFIACMSPVEENDVFVLDWEIPHGDPVGWCLAFVNRVHERVGVWPIVYMNGSTANSYDWSPIFNNCGLWVANWNNDPDDGPAVINKPYVMHQYTSDGSVPGIAGRVDVDAWYGTVEQFKMYGFQNAPQTPIPAPEPAPDPTPPPQPIPEPPTPDPLPPTPDSTPPIPNPNPVPSPEDPKKAPKALIAGALAAIAGIIAALIALLK